MKNKISILDNGDVVVYDHKRNGDVLQTKISSESYERLKSIDVKWCIVVNNSAGTYRVKTTIGGKKVYLHRLITDCPDNLVVDHINWDTLDNRLCNLRVTTQSVNAKNQTYIDSKYVYYDSRIKRYRVRIPVDGQKKNFGSFKSFDEASQHVKKCLVSL